MTPIKKSKQKVYSFWGGMSTRVRRLRVGPVPFCRRSYGRPSQAVLNTEPNRNGRPPAPSDRSRAPATRNCCRPSANRRALAISCVRLSANCRRLPDSCDRWPPAVLSGAGAKAPWTRVLCRFLGSTSALLSTLRSTAALSTVKPPSGNPKTVVGDLPAAVGHPPTAVRYPPTAVGYPLQPPSITLQPPSITLQPSSSVRRTYTTRSPAPQSATARAPVA